METRRSEVYRDGKWQEVEFELVQVGDLVRLFESDGTPVVDDGGTADWEVVGLSTNLGGQRVLHVVKPRRLVNAD